MPPAGRLDDHQELVDNARAATGSTLVVLSLYEAASGDIQVRAISGLGSRLARQALRLVRRRLPEFDPLELSSRGDANPFNRLVYEQGRPAFGPLSEFAAGVADPIVLEVASSVLGIQRGAFFPLLVEGRVEGSLAFLGRADLKGSERRVCEAFAGQAALSLEKAKLLEQLRAQVDELERSRKLLVSAEERVRRDVAGLLHGAVQGKLLVAWHRLGLCEELVERDPVGARELVVQVREEIDHIREHEIREASHRLHPGILDVGLLPAVHSLAARYDGVLEVEVEAAEQLTRLDDPGDNRIPSDLRFAVYRVIEEALGNVARHAAARSVAVRLGVAEGELEIVVSDDGRGIDTPSIRSGLGLRAMAFHVGALGGTVHVRSPQSGGAEVRARFPFEPSPPGRPPVLGV